METLSALYEVRKYYETGSTKPFIFRIQQLKKLHRLIEENEALLMKALHNDLRKNAAEAWATEIGFTLHELSLTMKHLKKWMRPKKLKTNLLNFPSKSFIQPEPLGVVLIISPWNYPFQLLFTPLIGAIAAGNCIVLKPSELAPATSEVMRNMIVNHFETEYILWVEGEGATVIPPMIENFQFNHIFYTGSTPVGKTIYQLAAQQLTPVTLELGGKSPCVIDADANIKVAANRIAATKFSNAGQMCVTPDYLLVHESVMDDFIRLLIRKIDKFFGKNAFNSKDFGRIINHKQFDRLAAYLHEGKIIYGGITDRADKYISPTLLTNISMKSSIMQDEIFGPLLPVIPFREKRSALEIIALNPNPLAFYIFSESTSNQQFWLNKVASGGACINNVAWHLTNPNIPFGGRGHSGIGSYHGEKSFEVFSHYKGVLNTPSWFDPAVKYPPYEGKLNLFKLLIK